jgi:hypothetical protein
MAGNTRAGLFSIYEIPPGGLAKEGEVFLWSSDTTPERAELGGARAAPLGPWKKQATLRSVRTDYPGAVVPSKQVLGAKHEKFSWSGTWDDRYNFDGYAVAEYKRAEKVLFRGNVVKIAFQDEEFLAFVEDLATERVTDWKIRYTLTVDPQCRTDNSEFKRSPTQMKTNPGDEVDALNTLMAGVAASQADRPATALTGSNTSGVRKGLADVSTRLDSVAQALDTKTGVLSPIGDFRSLSTQFRNLQGDITNVITGLVKARSDLDVGFRNAAAVLKFEDWTRNTRTLLRLARHRSQTAATGMELRDIHQIQAIYRPRKGESLYNVSRKAYGTPHRARDIQIANNLDTWTLTGDETLLIPQRGTA